jgi:hypothetical protein
VGGKAAGDSKKEPRPSIIDRAGLYVKSIRRSRASKDTRDAAALPPHDEEFLPGCNHSNSNTRTDPPRLELAGSPPTDNWCVSLAPTQLSE